MVNPPTPSFPMEQEKEIQEYISSITKPIFNKVLQEVKQNRISVKGSVSVEPQKCFYNPHNCRAYFDFSKNGKKNFKPIPNRTPANCTHKVVNSTEHNFKNFFSCTIRVRKNTIEIANQINPRWHLIEITTETGLKISEIVEQKIKECEKILKLFIEMIGGHSEFKLLNLVLKDNKIQGEKAIDQIPKKFKFQSRVGKKEYNESLFEFKSPVQVANYLENRAIENIAPEISNSLKQLSYSIRVMKPLKFLKKEIKSIKDLFMLKEDVQLLDKKEKEVLSKWIIATLSI